MRTRRGKEYKDLRPFVVEEIEKRRPANTITTIINAGGGGSGGGVTVHGLGDTGIHSGTLLDAQAPQFLLTSGARALTGNLAVNSGVTIDGVDISAHAADPDAHHRRASAGDGITVSAEQVVAVRLDPNSGLQFNSGALQMGTPTTLTAATINAVEGASHRHAITAYSDHKTNPGHLVKSDGSGLVEFATVYTDTLSADNHITIDPVGDVLFPQAQQVRSSNFLPGIPIQGWWIGQYSSGGVASTTRNAMQIYSLTVDELRARTFVVDEVRVDRGEEFVTKSYGIVARNFTVPGSIGATVTAYFEDSPAIAGAIFSNGDFLVFRIFDQSGGGLTIANFIFEVSGYTAQANNEQSWTLELVEGITGYEILKGNTGWDFGQSGQGYIHSSVVDTSGSPYMDIRTWSGTHPFEADIDTHVRIGYLISSLSNVMSPSGWGLFSSNAYLEGDLVVSNGDVRILKGDGINLAIMESEPDPLSEPLAIEWWYDIADRSGRPAAQQVVYKDGSAPNWFTHATTAVWPLATGVTLWEVNAWSSAANKLSRIAIQSPDVGDNNGLAVIQAQTVLLGRTTADGGVETEILTPLLNTFHIRPHVDNTYDLGGASLRFRTLYADQIIATTTSGDAISGQEWEYPGSMVIDANSGSDTLISLTNQGAGRADVDIDRNLTVGGTINGVDITLFDSRLDAVEGGLSVHAADATIHHLGGFLVDEHTIYLLANGTRQLTGNLSVAAGITIDTVDISNFKATYDAHVLATAAHGATGAVVGTTNTQTLTNKTLVAPNINDFVNAQHDHSFGSEGGQIAHSDLTGITANQHHNQSHVLATTGGLGADHTVSGLTAGMVLVATGLTTAAFGQLLHEQLGNLSNDDHDIYVHRSAARTIVVAHTFNPSSTGVPFIIGGNAAGQLVSGLNAEYVGGQAQAVFMRKSADSDLDMNGFNILEVGLFSVSSLGVGNVLFDYDTDTLTISSSVAGDNFVIDASLDVFDVNSASVQLGPASGGSISFFGNLMSGTNWQILTDGAATFGVDADLDFTFGRARLGYSTVTDEMRLAHIDHMSSGGGFDFALRQDNLGTTEVNAPSGQRVYLSTNANNRIYWDGTRFAPGSSITYDLGNYNALWRTLFVAEIYAQTLVAQDVLSTIGGRIAVTPTTSLIQAINNSTTTIFTKHNNLRNGEFAYLMAAPGGIPQFEAIQVVTDPSAVAGGYQYSVLRNRDGTGANSWNEGDALASLQKNVGEGYIEITSTNTVFQHLGPALTIYSRTATTNWNDTVAVVTIGNLDSWVGYGNVAGFAVGNNLLLTPSTGFKGLTADATNGLRIYSVDLEMFNGALQTVDLDSANGSLKLGTNIDNVATTTLLFSGTTGNFRLGNFNDANLVWENAALQIRDGATAVMEMAATGVLAIGKDIALVGTEYFQGLTADATNGIQLFNVDFTIYDSGVPVISLERDVGLALKTYATFSPSNKLQSIVWWQNLATRGGTWFGEIRAAGSGTQATMGLIVDGLSSDLDTGVSLSAANGSHLSTLNVTSGRTGVDGQIYLGSDTVFIESPDIDIGEAGGTITVHSYLGNLLVNGNVTFGSTASGSGATFTIGTQAGQSSVNSGNGRSIVIQAGSTDNVAGKVGGSLTLRPGAPVSPATAYGDVMIADQGGKVGIGLTGPATMLDVKGADGIISIRGTSTEARLKFYTSTSTLRAAIGFSTADGMRIKNEDNSPLKLGTATNPDTMWILDNGNVGIGTTTQFGSGVKVIGLANATTNPSTNPTGGVVIYADGGAAKVRGSSGTVSTFGPAEPHCPVCGRDYMQEFDNQEYGHFAICLACLADELGDRAWIIREKSRLLN